MNDATDRARPHDATGAPRTRRELRQRSASTEAPPGGTPFGTLAGLFAGPAAHTSPLPTILTVCTGNICRSPLAELLLRDRLGRDRLAGRDLRVHSAGTHGLVGAPMTDRAQQLARESGADAEQAAAHRARLLTEALLDDADLILTMTAEQRDHAVHLLPRRLHRIFPVREFARLARTLTDDQVRALADAAGTDPRIRLSAVAEGIGRRRGGVSPHREDEDVIDPYRRSFSVYQQSAAQLLPALDEVERVIRATVA